MNIDKFDSYECEGQMSLFEEDLPSSVFAVSKIFARAKKEMNVPELKTFTYALTHLRFKEENGNRVMLNKKKLAEIVGIHSDADHLSVDLKRAIGQLPLHSVIEFDFHDLDLYETGVLITKIRMHKNNVGITFNPDYMSLFSNLKKDYITMWSGDIFGMKSERSITFYEDLRLCTDTREAVCSKGYGVKALKELFGMAKEDYCDKQGHFQRTRFEERVIKPIVEDLKHCKMINLVVQSDGKYYEKVKSGGKVIGYKFRWTFSAYPSVASADEVKKLNERVDKNPEVLKVAKDLIEGTKKPKKKKGSFHNFEERPKEDVDVMEKFNKLVET